MTCSSHGSISPLLCPRCSTLFFIILFLSLITRSRPFFFFFFLKDPAPTEIYPLSLHDALPICPGATAAAATASKTPRIEKLSGFDSASTRCILSAIGYPPNLSGNDSVNEQPLSCPSRSEEHTSELQSPDHLVCRLLLEKKNK